MVTKKEKVIERLTEEIKDREVLAVKRDGPGHTWFHLVIDGTKVIVVYDEDCTWEINDQAKKVTVDLIEIKVQDFPDIGGRNKAVIKGNREQINNLLYNLGMGLASERVKPSWKYKDNDEWSDNAMDL